MTVPKRELASGNRLKLGLFSANCSGGLAITKVPERWPASWDGNKSLAITADQVGLDFLLRIARWRGYGGEGDFQGSSLDTFAWTAGLLAVTARITVLSTVHTAFTHPVAAARQFATIDQIGHGRFGVNVVCGWNEPEYRLFGLDLPREHRARHAYGQEWLDIVRKLWLGEASFDWHGTYFHLEQATGEPRPWSASEPIIFNAAASLEGREFAVRNSDVSLTSLVNLGKTREEVATLKSAARAKHGRAVEVIGGSYVVCRPTRREALDYHRYYAEEMVDEAAVDRLMTLLGQHAKSFTKEELRQHRIRFAGGHGTYPLLDSPDDIADELERISVTGLSGTTVAFVSYSDEFPYFRDEVLPRLERKGLRPPIQC
jgi:dimethylsulfone monooxygenase